MSPATPLTASLPASVLTNRTEKIGGHQGAVIAPHYEPYTLLSNPPRPSDVTLELLLASQAHLGHHTSLWNPANSRYIFGIRDGIHIISLEVTAAHLRRAAKVVTATAQRAGIILFVGSRPGQARCVVRAAQMAGAYHLFERWTPGTITNAMQILKQSKLKVVNELDEEVTGFDQKLREQAPLKPDLVICLNPMENGPLLQECATHSIPTIGVIDTDADPTRVTYPIPANDDRCVKASSRYANPANLLTASSIRCIQVIAGVLGRAGEEGYQQRLAFAKDKSKPARDRIPYPFAKTLFSDGTDRKGDDEYTQLKEENMLLLAPTREAVDARIAERQQRKTEQKEREDMEGAAGDEDEPEANAFDGDAAHGGGGGRMHRGRGRAYRRDD